MPPAAQETLATHPERYAPAEIPVSQLGALAAEQGLARPEISFSPLQAGVIDGLSKGNTARQTAAQLAVPLGSVKEAKKDFAGLFPSLSAGVDYAIARGAISFEKKPDPELTARLSALDLGFLQAFAGGGITPYAEGVSSGRHKDARSFEKQLLKKIRAWSRPHAVRRGYELGIFSINEREAL
jgi:hypothetical protein